MYPAGTLVKIIKSDRHAKASPRANSIGYVANSEGLQYLRLPPKKNMVGKLVLPPRITVELVNIVFVRFGNQMHDRHENHGVVVFKPELFCNFAETTRHVEAVSRLISRDLTTEEESHIRERLGSYYKMPWAFIDRHEDIARMSQLADSLVCNYKFIDFVKRVSSLGKSACIHGVKNPLIELLSLADILHISDAAVAHNREFCRNLNSSLKNTFETLHVMFKSAELGIISNEVVEYITKGVKRHNNNDPGTINLQRYRRDFECILEDLFYSTTNKLAAKHLDSITKTHSHFRLEEKMSEMQEAFENYKKILATAS